MVAARVPFWKRAVRYRPDSIGFRPEGTFRVLRHLPSLISGLKADQSLTTFFHTNWFSTLCIAP